MSEAANALLGAIARLLAADVPLSSLLAEPGLRDRQVVRPSLPAVLVGEMDTRDFSTGDGPGEEHFLTLEIWVDAGGRKIANTIAARIRALLDDRPLLLEGLTLVSLFATGTKSRREPKTSLFRLDLRFRAVTE